MPEDVNFLMIGTPVQTSVPLTAAFLPRLKAGCVISDVGSVKAEIVRGMDRLLPKNIPFVPGHPIAGSEQWGARAAKPDLFLGRRTILTPTRKTDKAALKKVAMIWRKVGAKVELMDPEVHDRVLGLISHLPHVLVYALVNALDRSPGAWCRSEVLLRRWIQRFHSYRFKPAGVVARHLFDEPTGSGPIAWRLYQQFEAAEALDRRR